MVLGRDGETGPPVAESREPQSEGVEVAEIVDGGDVTALASLPLVTQTSGSVLVGVASAVGVAVAAGSTVEATLVVRCLAHRIRNGAEIFCARIISSSRDNIKRWALLLSNVGRLGIEMSDPGAPDAEAFGPKEPGVSDTEHESDEPGVASDEAPLRTRPAFDPGASGT